MRVPTPLLSTWHNLYSKAKSPTIQYVTLVPFNCASLHLGTASSCQPQATRWSYSRSTCSSLVGSQGISSTLLSIMRESKGVCPGFWAREF